MRQENRIRWFEWSWMGQWHCSVTWCSVGYSSCPTHPTRQPWWAANLSLTRSGWRDPVAPLGSRRAPAACLKYGCMVLVDAASYPQVLHLSKCLQVMPVCASDVEYQKQMSIIEVEWCIIDWCRRILEYNVCIYIQCVYIHSYTLYIESVYNVSQACTMYIMHSTWFQQSFLAPSRRDILIT